MLPIERERNILNLVQELGTVTVRDLSARFNVTEVTIRRDLQKLESESLLLRTHGGAMSLESGEGNVTGSDIDHRVPDIDALIISPVNNRAAHTLREKAIRHQIPLISESVITENALYLGPRNYDAGYELGTWVRQYLLEHNENTSVVLDITQRDLPNTAERSQGFSDGLGQEIEIISIDGQALYDQAYRVATDALLFRPDINVIFGINDDSLLAGLQAYTDLGYNTERVLAVNIGGEGNTIFDMLVQPGPFKACVALFPELVGRMGIDAVTRLWTDQPMDGAIHTPHRLLTPQTLTSVYQQVQKQWQLRQEALSSLVTPEWTQPPSMTTDRCVSFVIHYRTHEWYQSLARAMAARAAELGIDFRVQDLHEDLAAE
ncbi:MAG: substrate-binding domain-containing protein, partial [Chloroflexota bacterium]